MNECELFTIYVECPRMVFGDIDLMWFTFRWQDYKRDTIAVMVNSSGIQGLGVVYTESVIEGVEEGVDEGMANCVMTGADGQEA